MKTLHIKTSRLCERLFELERKGQYEEALYEIGDLWRDKTVLPDTQGLSPYLKAELILRCGSLFGFLGHNKQIPESQEKSRNLLTHARNLFIELYDVEKLSECENYLALTYWRTGETNEAASWLEESFSHKLPKSNDTRIYTYIIKSLIELSSNQPQMMLETLDEIKEFIFKSKDDCLKGAYHNQIGVAWDLFGNVPKALENLEAAKFHFKKAEHQIYAGVVCNDLALLYITARNFEKAHEMNDASNLIFKKIQDRTREGFSLDTKSKIFLSEKRHDDALATIEKAIAILGIGENAAYLVETMKTKIKVLISMSKVSAATFCLIEAVELAKTKINENAANALVNDYEHYVLENLKSGSEADVKADGNAGLDDFELVLPSPLSNFEDIQGVWIHSSHLEGIGILKNSLAVIAPTDDVKRGDLVALEEIENGEISCGFYDNEFGIVCLEGDDGEPLLFDEEKIKIVGKIVGVAADKTDDGKLIVKPV